MITVAFIIFMWRMLKYFIAQIQLMKEQEKAFHGQVSAERNQAHKLFNQALESNNAQVGEWLEKLSTCLEKQERTFQDLISLIEKQRIS